MTYIDKKIAQNAQYTYKYNKNIGKHGWLRLTPAYSVKVVEEIINNLPYTPSMVLDPFSGTATTPLVCAAKCINACSIDINPFLVWFGNTKLCKYDEVTLTELKQTAIGIVNKIKNDQISESTYPKIYNISRWWGDAELKFLSQLKNGIVDVENTSVKNLLLVALCRTLIEISNAAFNHVSTSFNKSELNTYHSLDEMIFKFQSAIMTIIETCNPSKYIADANVYLGDSRNIPSVIKKKYDTVITSPPYPNRISYIRELRPYMYWLDYLEKTEDASSLDWKAVGGTWGSATNNLKSWNCNEEKLPKSLTEICNKINGVDNKYSQILSNYVKKYFYDMQCHLESIYNTIDDDGCVQYIIGNSFFYNVHVPSNELYKQMMIEIGFENVEEKIIRKRNCNKGLFEYIISAVKK